MPTGLLGQMDGRTDMDKPISLRLRQGIKIAPTTEKFVSFIVVAKWGGKNENGWVTSPQNVSTHHKYHTNSSMQSMLKMMTSPVQHKLSCSTNKG